MSTNDANLNDNELALSAALGDKSAFAALIDRHYEPVFRLAYRWCGVKEDAEDITQDVLIKLARSIRAFRGESAFSTWLYRITVNAAKDFHRRNSTKRAYEEDYAAELPLTGNNAPEADSTAFGDRRVKAIYRAIDILQPGLKEAVLLVLAEGLSHREAAEILGCAEATVSWRIFQAKRKLKQILDKEEA